MFEGGCKEGQAITPFSNDREGASICGTSCLVLRDAMVRSPIWISKKFGWEEKQLNKDNPKQRKVNDNPYAILYCRETDKYFLSLKTVKGKI